MLTQTCVVHGHQYGNLHDFRILKLKMDAIVASPENISFYWQESIYMYKPMVIYSNK